MSKQKYVAVLFLFLGLLLFGAFAGCGDNVSDASVTVPSAPTGLTVANVTNSTITLTWTTVPNATGYYVYQSTSQYGTYSPFSTAFANPPVTNTGLSTSMTLWFKVSAFNAAGESALSSSVLGTTLSSSIYTAPGVSEEGVLGSVITE
jgi:hypothetical protein